MRYRLFLSDFDGTLVRADGTISPRVKEAISRYRTAGGIFAVCTGRMVTAIAPRVRELGISGPVAAYQGATVFDAETGDVLLDNAFETEDALRAIEWFERDGQHIQAYTIDCMYSNVDDEMLAAYEKICRVKATIVSDEPLSSFVRRKGMRIVKVLAMVEPQARFDLRDRAQAALGDRFYVTCSSEWLVEVMPQGQNKGNAVQFLSDYYGVPLSETAAIGDQLNDLPMLMRAGGKFTLRNAEDELKRLDCVTVVSSNEEDGVAEALGYAMEGES